MSRVFAAGEVRKARLGLAVLAALVLLGALAWEARQRREAAWELTLPTHPSRLGRVEVVRSRLAHWKMWSYPAAASAAELEVFYDEALTTDGWATADGEWVGRARVKSYRRDVWRLELRTVPAADGQNAVALLLSDVGSEDERAR